jgi:hypothetical protein
LGFVVHRCVIRRLRAAPSRYWRRSLIVSTALFIVGLPASPVSSQADVADPNLDVIMKMTPPGYQRAERDRLPEGPMTAATFNRIGATAVPVRADNAVVYGASYERPDGAIIIFLGMSTTRRGDGQAFADRVIEGTLTTGEAFSVGIDGVAGVEGESNGTHAAAIAFARNGRGFAVISFGDGARDDGATFATIIEGLAESSPPRSDARPDEQLRPAAAAVAAVVALAVFGIVASWRLVQRRRSAPRGVGPIGLAATPDTLEHPLPATSPRRSPRPNPR